MKHALHSILLSALMLVSGVASAQGFPNKPIRMVIGFPPGTSIDPDARRVANEMEKRLGQSILLEFKPGAGGTIAAKYVADAPPDGYTLFYGNTVSIHPIFILNNAVDASKEFSPVSTFVTIPLFLFSSAKLPVASIKELVAYAKANPGALKHGSTSPTGELLMQMSKDRSGADSQSILYKGSPQMITALLSGEISLTASTLAPFLGYVQDGRIHALYIMSRNRSSLLPNVPTAAEAGLPNFEMAINFGAWAPLRTPIEVRQKLSSEVAIALKNPALVDQIRKGSGGEPVGSTPEEELQIFNAEIKAWSDAARKANFQPQ